MPITSMVIMLLSMDGFSFLSNSGFIWSRVLSIIRNVTIPMIKEFITVND